MRKVWSSIGPRDHPPHHHGLPRKEMAERYYYPSVSKQGKERREGGRGVTGRGEKRERESTHTHNPPTHTHTIHTHTHTETEVPTLYVLGQVHTDTRTHTTNTLGERDTHIYVLLPWRVLILSSMKRGMSRGENSHEIDSPFAVASAWNESISLSVTRTKVGREREKERERRSR